MLNQIREIKFTVADIPDDIPAERIAEAERKAKEAFVMELLRHGEVSAGRAARQLGVNRWQLSDIMSEYGVSPFDETMTREELRREVADALKDLEIYKR